MAVPAGLTFAFWGVDYNNPPPIGVVAYLIGEGFDPTQPPIGDGTASTFEVAVEGDVTLVEGFDYSSTAGDGDQITPGQYLIYLDDGSLDGNPTNVETYGWEPFDPAVVGTKPSFGGGLDDYPLDPGLTPSTYDPAALTGPTFQDCPISADTLGDGTLKQRFDTRAFPNLGDRLTGTLDDGIEVPEPARAVG